MKNPWKYKWLGGITYQPSKKEMFSNNIQLMLDEKDENGNLLDFLLEMAIQKKIYFKYRLSRRYNTIKIYSEETDEEMLCWFFPDGLGWLRALIFNYWDNRCVFPECRISEEELWNMYKEGKIKRGQSNLALHHIIPLSFFDDRQNKKVSYSPLDMFEPRCYDHHSGGLQ